jgi:hypothetical protein
VTITYLKPISSAQATKGRARGGTWRLFKWVAAAALVTAFYLLSPRPYLRWQYEFTSTGGTYDPRAARTYHRCDYLGAGGTFTVRPNNGVCDAIVWRPPGKL